MIPLKQKTVVRESVNEFKDPKPFTVEKVQKKEEVADVDIFQPTAQRLRNEEKKTVVSQQSTPKQPTPPVRKETPKRSITIEKPMVKPLQLPERPHPTEELEPPHKNILFSEPELKMSALWHGRQ